MPVISGEPMKTQKEIQGDGFVQNALAALRRELRKWYGMISVQELASNRELAIEIGILEKMLAREGV